MQYPTEEEATRQLITNGQHLLGPERMGLIADWQDGKVATLPPGGVWKEAPDVGWLVGVAPAAKAALEANGYDMLKQGVPGFMPNPENLGDGFNVFQEIVEKDGIAPSVLYQDAHVIVMVPADPNKFFDQPHRLQPVSFKRGGESGRSSLAHVLVIPKRRIYNAITLTKADTPLVLYMDAVGRRVLVALVAADSSAVGTTAANPAPPAGTDKHTFVAHASNHFPSNEASNVKFPLLTSAELGVHPDTMGFDAIAPELLARGDRSMVGGLDLAPDSAIALAWGDAVFSGFQTAPYHSVGWLHMHVMSLPLRTQAGMGYFSRRAGLAPEGFVGQMVPTSAVVSASTK